MTLQSRADPVDFGSWGTVHFQGAAPGDYRLHVLHPDGHSDHSKVKVKADGEYEHEVRPVQPGLHYIELQEHVGPHKDDFKVAATAVLEVKPTSE